MKQLLRSIPIAKELISYLSSIRRTQRLLGSNNARFLTFSPPGHFYSPIPDLNDVNARRASIFDGSVSDIPGLDLNVDGQLSLLDAFASYYGDFPFGDRPTENMRYYADNDFFSYGDGVALYSFLRHLRPKRIIEVGSGFSSAAMLDINDLFAEGSIDFVFIEPYPERLHRLLRSSDATKCEIIEKPIQEVPPSLFATLEQDDILFIDSSHVAKIGSDVNHIVFAILPLLRSGVVVHFHDVLWPFEYPDIWLQDGRAWNEAYLVRAFLQYNNAFKILFFNSFLEAHYSESLSRKAPLMLKKPSSQVTPGNASLWIKKIARE